MIPLSSESKKTHCEMPLEMADTEGVFARAPRALADPTSAHFTSFHSHISPFVHKLQGALQRKLYLGVVHGKTRGA